MKKISVFLSAVLMGMLVMVPVNAVNDYFTHSDRMASGAKVRAEQFNNVFDSIVTGLDKLPSQVQSNRGTRNYATATGSLNAYAIASALSHITGSYAAAQEVYFLANHTNTGPSTLNVSGIGASAIVNKDGSAIAAGVIQNNSMVHVRYNTTRSSWELMGAYILSSGVSVSAFASTLLDDADAAAMLVTLGSTPGTVTSSDAVVVDANKDALGFRKITGSTSTGYTAEFTYTGTTANDMAMRAFATGASGQTFAGYFSNASTTGYGVSGVATAGTGANFGVNGRTDSSGGYGVYADATVSGGIPLNATGYAAAAGDGVPVAAFNKGNSSIQINALASSGAYNPIVQTYDQHIMTNRGGIDTGVLTLAPYATDAVGIRISSATDNVTVTGTTITLTGALNGSGVVDEDTMVSNSDTRVPTQQSVKAYVDAGNRVLIQTVSSGTPVAELAFASGGISTTYRQFEIVVTMKPNTNGESIYCQLGDAGGWFATNYEHVTGQAWTAATAATFLPLSGAVTGTSSEVAGIMRILQPNGSAQWSVIYDGAYIDNSTGELRQYKLSGRRQTTVPTRVRFYASTGNVIGSIRLYGMK